MRLLLLLPVASLMLSACSSTPDPEQFAGKVTDNFQAEIKSDGMKLFTYSVTAVKTDNRRQRPQPNMDATEHQRSRSQPQEDMRPQRMGRRDGAENKQMTQELEIGLQKTLESNQYCRDGYYELERLVLRDRAELRGECHEGASEQDIKRFGYGKYTDQSKP
ncbi:MULTISPECIES: hypothetical protein [Shewanella]|jgi:hypothetical protein|uniref:Lipoprotein n=1 Tax=Shewanella fodinae TaxID=552357 RepID=A0A4R2FKG5_9GAMM|nr:MULTISPECIES: hypothetical protein [Shewanella]MBO1273442.1 hypothetical protein [Shewanella sp. 4t3-1-2LB]TCN83621.1 hypothetical protein EDC91_11417 [Shewanella fodinae]